VRYTLHPLGYEISECADGQAALEQCRQALPELIITDIMMPRLDGTEFVMAFRSEFQDRFVPILMLTVLADLDNKVQGLEVGADDYLSKPFHFRELQARVQALLRIKSLTESLYGRTRELEAANNELQRVQEELLRSERQAVAGQMARTALHNLGQPITALILNTSLLERMLDPQKQLETQELCAQARGPLQAMRSECESIQQILAKLKLIDANQTADYVGKITIFDLPDS
jgi:DNA-binding response OmpR family regulator